MGGNRIDYTQVLEVHTPTGNLTLAKLIFNSTISTSRAKFMDINIKNFYLHMDMDRYKYMWIPVNDIPPEIFVEYGLKRYVHNNQVLAEIRKGMYGLPQAGILAHKKLKKHLSADGYVPAPASHLDF
jgi:hypothetical protein